MSVELIIDSSPTETVIAILNDKKLVELQSEDSENRFSVGDIYLGKIKKIMPGLNAAFVNVGYEKDAFLHYLDLGPQFSSLNKYTTEVRSKKHHTSKLDNFKFEPDINKGGKVNDLLKSGQEIVVQIEKEPISSKGPRLSSELSLAGRYLVLVPFSDRVSVSSKIRSNEEKDRLRRLIESIRPPGFGIIIRTVAQDKKVADLHQDLRDLVERWNSSYQRLRNAKPPKKILGELDRASAVLRDLLSKEFNGVHVNDESMVGDIKNLIGTLYPGKEEIVKPYTGKLPIFEHFGVNKQIKGLFGKNVTMTSGAYLIIEHTEAMHVIDVNSGPRTKKDNDQEQNALDTNLEAAEEIARQLRLRDMGGIIVVDFIDMRNAGNRKKLYEALKKCMKEDRAKHTILPPSKFGLVQITRQRVRPEMEIKTKETCPTCNGTGEIQASILIADEIENNLNYVKKHLTPKNITIYAHPYVSAYLEQNLPALKKKGWFAKKKDVKVVPMDSYHLLQYAFHDHNDEEIKING